MTGRLDHDHFAVKITMDTMLSWTTLLVSNGNDIKSRASPVGKKRQNRPLSVDLRTSIVDEILRNGGDITMNFFDSKSATTKFARFDLSERLLAVSVIYI